jgi:hypothetical protein
VRSRPGRGTGRRDTDRAAHDRLVGALHRAFLHPDPAHLRAVLDPGVTLWVDAAGSTEATPGVVEGVDDTARALCRILRARPGVDVAVGSVNGRAGLVVRHDGVVTGVLSVAVRSDRVTKAWLVLSPAKLQGWNRA